MQSLMPFLREYIWNREAFELESSKHKPPPWQGQAKKQRELSSCWAPRRTLLLPRGGGQGTRDGAVWPISSYNYEPAAAASRYWYQSSNCYGTGKAAATPSPASAPPCLWGAVRFGDNIEDEWVIVSLLLQLCSLQPSLSIQVGAVWCLHGLCVQATTHSKMPHTGISGSIIVC